ncbi:MAG: hypothetical protein K2P99_03290 [Burkholderiales bacterium]|nr:hypothetical protein [Burkholderiales bacterium]
MKIFYNVLSLSMAVLFSYAHADCKLINKQCLDNQATKIIGGISFKLADACSVNGLSGVDCCWNLQKQYLCPSGTDTCNPLRHNPNCNLLENTCIEKDSIAGKCNKFQSKYSCAAGYEDVESRICTNVVCGSNNNNVAERDHDVHTCNPKPYSNECEQYSSQSNCELTHQGTCISFGEKKVTCNPYNHECDDVARDVKCQQTQVASCADLEKIKKICTIEKSPNGSVVSDACANGGYYNPAQWALSDSGNPYACGEATRDTKTYNCDPTTGECNQYSSNPSCTLTKPYIQATCHYDCDSSYHGGDSNYCPYWQGAYNHDNNWVSGTCNTGQTYYANAVRQTITCGKNIGNPSPGWHVSFSNCTNPQLAQYTCTTTHQDSCQDFTYKSLTQVECKSGYQPSIYTCKADGCTQFDPSVYTCSKFKCFDPMANSADNQKNMGNAIAYLQMGQSMAQDMKCSNPNDPSTCTLFSGKYFSCYMYAFIAGQPGSWNNGGADCMIHHDFFTQANVPTGYATSDRNLYSQATSGTGNIMGSSLNYSLSNDDTKAINNSVDLYKDSKSPITNQDQNVHYDGNNSKNPNIGLDNGKVVSVTINKSTIQDLTGLTAFKAYLSDTSVNLAWNRQKSEPDPNNIKNITFGDEGITRKSGGNPFGWIDPPNQPLINGLCVHFADFCEGGENDATYSDLIKVELAWAGGLTNPNFCAKCIRDPILNTCILGEPRQVLQQWCCFSSKVALDINLAAYDQGLLNIYKGGDRYTDQIEHSNGVCGGITVGMISKIDFSKGNYFNDLMNSMDINQLIDNSNFTNSNIQGNTQNRSNIDATNMVNEWKKKNQK